MKQRKNRMMIIALCAINLFTAMTHAVEEYRNWDNILISEETLNFPKDFVWGTASSDFQIAGNQTANGKFSENNWTRDKFRPQPGIAADHWNRYEEDIENIAKAGMRHYRFSVDWSKIEPKKGEIDQDAMDHYAAIARECKKRNIEPIVCLFHHVWPTWFADQGAFEKIENKEDFKNFAYYVQKNMQSAGVHWWMTYNEPVGVVLESYLRGKLPPGQVGHLIKAGQVLRNMLNTHVEISQEFKKNDKDAKFGIAHIMQPLNPYHDYNPLEKSICSYFGGLNNDTIIEFFKTGKFNWGGLVKDENKAAPASIDYFGLNYYTHSLIKQNMKKTAIAFGASSLAITGLVQKGLIKPSTGLGLGVISAIVSSCLSLSVKSHREGTSASDEKQIYPEGLRGCIEKASSAGKPIYITENGISDRSGDKREEYIKKHLYIVSEAIKDGYDIRGYHYWSFMDHFSWSTAGFKKKYGIYEVDYEGNTLTRTLRENAKWFVALMRKHTGMNPIN